MGNCHDLCFSYEQGVRQDTNIAVRAANEEQKGNI